jgi:hypothetical protein
MSETVEITLNIPDGVFEWLASRAQRGGLPSAAAYAEKLVSGIVSVMQEGDNDVDDGVATEEELIARRLRALGYIE